MIESQELLAGIHEQEGAAARERFPNVSASRFKLKTRLGKQNIVAAAVTAIDATHLIVWEISVASDDLGLWHILV